MSALNKVRRMFPQVTKVRDAKRNVRITVTDADCKTGRKKNASECALAKACKRQKLADGAIIGLSISYLINGTTATRYQTSVAVGREITSFDRHHDFAAGGDYLLSKINKAIRLGVKHRGGTTNGRMGPRKRHKTEFVRSMAMNP